MKHDSESPEPTDKGQPKADAPAHTRGLDDDLSISADLRELRWMAKAGAGKSWLEKLWGYTEGRSALESMLLGFLAGSIVGWGMIGIVTLIAELMK